MLKTGAEYLIDKSFFMMELLGFTKLTEPELLSTKNWNGV